jgi:membrane dipeptidase
LIVDAHLDIAYNALAEGRGFEGPPAPRYLVSRQALDAAGVGLIFPTVFAHPRKNDFAPAGPWSYDRPREAYLIGLAQVGYYRSLGLELLRTGAEVRTYRRTWRPGRLAGVLLMENADPLESPSQLPEWLDMGVRVIGPAWARTRYCGGTAGSGGLTAAGRDLLERMGPKGVILDLSHMADRAWRESLELYRGPVVATHGGARTLNPGQRQFPDALVSAVGERRGVVGVSFYSGHLRASGAARLDDVVRHLRHFADVTAGPEFVGLGSDLDGGFDASQAPLRKLTGLSGLASRLRRHFSAGQVDGIMGENWLDFLERALP